MHIPSTHHSLLALLNEQRPSNVAWEVFHARYREVILTWCQRRGLGAEAEDLTQEILIKLLRALPVHVHNPAQGRFRGWLKTVVENAVRDLWRKRAGSPERPGIGGSTYLGQIENLASLEEEVDELSEALEARQETEAARIVNHVRAQVEEKTWRAFVQMSLEQRPAADVAAELELTVATVYKHVDRVKKKLREAM